METSAERGFIKMEDSSEAGLHSEHAIMWQGKHPVQVTVHTPPRALLREMERVFPGQDLGGLLVIATCQQARHDLVRVGDMIEAEKDRLLEVVRSAT
jgi:hypothetical protein